MKYIVKCNSCGEYELKTSIKPCCCVKCGESAEVKEFVSAKARQRAEKAMSALDELRPLVEKARDDYMSLMVLYENECQLIRKYAQRGIVTPEEKAKYLISSGQKKKDLNTLLKEYRVAKKAEQEKQ